MKHALRRSCLFTLFFSSLLAFFSGCSNSNDYEIFGSIHGVVSDSSNGQPLENATILLSPSGLTKNTDATGYYKFENLETQQYTLTVQKQGYQPNRKTVTTISGEDLQVDILLTPIPQ